MVSKFCPTIITGGWMVDKVKQGKKNRAAGGAFELRVRKDLEGKDWIVDKWTNNVDLDSDDKAEECKIGKLIPAKRKYAGPGRPMAIGTGFPDFVAFKPGYCSLCNARGYKVQANYELIGVESKSNGYLDKTEKAKCRWLLDNKIFARIYVASKTKVKNRVVITYNEFKK